MPTVNAQHLLHKGRTFSFVKESVTLQNGVTVELEIVRHPGAAAVVPFVDDETILLLKQYRHAVGGFIWEIPAGTLGPDEEALDCARRELAEETGFAAKGWEKLGEITPIPGYSDERIHLFRATRLMPAEQNLDRDEVLDVHQKPLKTVLDMIACGDIQDAKTICAIFHALRIRHGEGD